jgi:hypothetical protein
MQMDLYYQFAILIPVTEGENLTMGDSQAGHQACISADVQSILRYNV